MKAAVMTRYGPPEVLAIRDVPTPEPKTGEVRIKVEATTVTAGDFELRGMKLPLLFAIAFRLHLGIFTPRRTVILGQELAGTVDKVGAGVTRFKPGDKVMARTGISFGGAAEYICLPESSGVSMVTPRPDSLSAEEAACLPFAAFEARFFMDKAAIRPGEKLLVVGAGGSIGTYAIQIAKAMGAEVTAVDRAAKHEMLAAIGADHVVDATAPGYGAPGSFDIVFDVVGKGTFGRGYRALHRGGRLVSANPRFNLLFRALWARLAAGKRTMIGTATHTPEAIEAIGELVAAGKVKPVIGRSFALADIVDAHRYAESGAKIGNVAVRCG